MNRLKKENGQALAVVVAIMVVGSLIMTASLAYLFASASASGSTRDQVDAYYVADAGVEAVLAELVENGDGAGTIAGAFPWGGGSLNGYQPTVSVVDLGLVIPLPTWTYYSHDYEITSTAGGTEVTCYVRYNESIWGNFVSIVEWSTE